jgi:phytoene dehydrogenase-like protein
LSTALIVGAGISGLAAGIALRQSGIQAEIYESHSIPGGASTGWRRGEYFFEGGMHWLTGSSPKSPLNALWRELGALGEDVAVENRDPFLTIEHGGGEARLFRDPKRLRNELCSHFPEDEREIARLCRDILVFSRVQMPVTDLKGLKLRRKSPSPLPALLRLLPALPKMTAYSKMSTAEYAGRFQNPALRALLLGVVGGENAATALLFTLGTLAAGDGGCPEGGSVAMAARMARKFEGLGGRIHYGRQVRRVLTRDGRASGLLLADGDLIESETVLVTQDLLSAIDALFDPPLSAPWAEEQRRKAAPVLCSFVSLGVRADLGGRSKAAVFALPRPFICAGERYESVLPYLYAGPPHAPQGQAAITLAFMGDHYAFWQAARQRGEYETEKARLGEGCIRLLEELLPETRSRFELYDVATPLSYERYLHSFKGSWMSLQRKGEFPRTLPSGLSGISGLYFAGQRLMPPGGLPVALLTGRAAAQAVCRDHGLIFQGAI